MFQRPAHCDVLSLTLGLQDWKDVDLTLETAEPTFGVDIPHLSPWTISVHRPVMFPKSMAKRRSFLPQMSAPSAAFLSANMGGEEYGPVAHEAEAMRLHEAYVNSKGNITATFGVPGKITIPSDGATHNVTIVKLNLDATMRWVTVPKQEAKTHLSVSHRLQVAVEHLRTQFLQAKIKNASEYTLLSGQASIYVNGSFIARTDVPPVSPEESFDCPLGFVLLILSEPMIDFLQTRSFRSGYISPPHQEDYAHRLL